MTDVVHINSILAWCLAFVQKRPRRRVPIYILYIPQIEVYNIERHIVLR